MVVWGHTVVWSVHTEVGVIQSGCVFIRGSVVFIIRETPYKHGASTDVPFRMHE